MKKIRFKVLILIIFLAILSNLQYPIYQEMPTLNSLPLEEGVEEIYYGPYLSLLKIAVIDTEINYNHPLFMNRIKERQTIFTEEIPQESNNSHGTMVAGVIAKYLTNVNLVSIVIPKETNAQTLAKAINTAVDLKVDIINISLSTYKDDMALQSAVERAINKGVIIVCSAGNDGTRRYTYPGSYKGVITVSGVSKNGAILPYSNFNDNVDIFAIAENIPTVNFDSTDDFGSILFSGTSAATPVVTALVGVIKSYNYNANVDQILHIIKASSYNVFNNDKKIQMDILNISGVINDMKVLQEKKGIVVNSILVFLMIVVGIAFIFFQKNDISIERNANANDITSLEQFILSKLKDDYIVPKNVEVQTQEWNDNEVVVKYTYEVENKTGEGLIYASFSSNQYKYIDGVHSLINSSNPFTNQGLGYSNLNEQISVISGYINDDNINSIKIFYNDNSIELIKIGEEQDTFISAHWTGNKTMNSMIAYDKNKREIYKYSW